jgi:hypothetical protein
MKRILVTLTIFFFTYGAAYWWGVYDLHTNPPTIDNDGDLATLGMMPIFLHLYGIGLGIFLAICYWVHIFFRKLLNKRLQKNSFDDFTK